MKSNWASALCVAATAAILAGAASAQSAFVKVGPETVYDAGDRCGVPFWDVADFNHDGHPDFALFGYPTNVWASTDASQWKPAAVMLWIAQPDGSYKEMASQMFNGPVTAAYASQLRVDDFNGDGIPDIYLPSYGLDNSTGTPDTPKLALSTPAGFVDASAQFANFTPRLTHTGAIADIDGNGTVDLYVGSNTGAPVEKKPYLLVNDGSGNFTYTQALLPTVVLAQQPAQGARSQQIDATKWYVADERFLGSEFADVNRDGYPDLVLEPGPYAPNGFVFLNDGWGDFSKLLPIELPPGAYGGNWLITELDAFGWFTSPRERAPGPGTVQLDTRAVELNGDGYPDLVVLQTLQQESPEKLFYRGGRIQILINQNGRGFVDDSAARGAPGFDVAADHDAYHSTLTVADVNGDGFPDLIAIRVAGKYTPHVYLNDGNGRFARTTLPGIPENGLFIAVSGGFRQTTRLVNVRFNPKDGATGGTGCSLAVQTWERPAPASKAFDLNQHGLTGTWYEVATSGQGVGVEVFANPASGTGSTFVSWFTYDTVAGGAERQRWYTAQGQVVTGQPSAALTIYQNTGGNFNAPPATTAQAVGTATLRFDTCSRGQLAYAFTDGTGRTGTTPLTRLTQNVTCSTTTPYTANLDFALSGNWYDPETSGQGFTVEVNPISGMVFAAWYTYLPNGTASGAAGQRWYTAQAAFTPGLRSMPVTIYETTGGAFDTALPGQNTVPVGTGTMAFQSCSAATFSYNFTGGSSNGLSGTINLSRVGPLPPGCAM